MTEFVSEIKTISSNQGNVYRVLSDLSNLEQVKDRIPQDKVTDLAFDADSCSFSVSPVGNVKFSIVERTPDSTIKFAADQLPVDLFLWIQLKSTGEEETKMKITVKAELNMMIKPMVSKPLQDGVNKLADVLANIPY